MTKENKEEVKSMVVVFRVFQAIFFGILALGLSLMAGDLSEAINLPFSSFSLTTTIFGGIGALITGILANNCKNW